MDLYYRAFKHFRNHTKDDLTSQKLRKNITHAQRQHDVLTSIKYECTIEEDWILNIEEGLIFVEKAIREDRQFIRTEGEVVPIEKVKRVSKSSVEHLSKHSDFITRAPKENDDLIPDKLYIVEKLNDYLVYENRFIYMLLNYLKDFIQMRIDKIREKTTSYESHMTLNKDFDINQRHLQYRIDYHDFYENDEYLKELYEKIPLVKRIETIYATVVALIGTPLMREVSKAPLIKPPVVKTNVLRMNQNFRASLKLYDYVTSYMTDGFTFKEIKKTFQPFPDDFADEVADTIQLTSVIAYMVGNDFRDAFDKEFNRLELEKKAFESKKAADELRRLKKRLIEMDEDLDSYVIQLEKRNSELEKDSADFYLEKEKTSDLLKMIEKIDEEKTGLEESIIKLKEHLANKEDIILKLNQKYVRDMMDAEKAHQKDIVSLESKHQEHLKHLESTFEHEKTQMTRSFNREKEQLLNSHKEVINELHEEMNTYRHRETELNQQINAYIKNEDQLKREIIHLDDEKKQTHARYLAVKVQHGLITDQDDFTSKERFKELELEMKAYKKLFKEQWKKTKLKIKEQVKEELKDTTKNEEEHMEA